MSIVDWIENPFWAGCGRSSAGSSTSRTRSSTEPTPPSRARSTSSTCSATRGRGQFRVFGKSNEKYHVRGGNDQIPQRLRERLPGQVTLGAELVAVEAVGDGYRLAFRGAAPPTVVADKLVLALPFSILRHSVDLSQAGFSDLKLRAIAQQGTRAGRSATASARAPRRPTPGSSSVRSSRFSLD
jgi:monoamine oxidase